MSDDLGKPVIIVWPRGKMEAVALLGQSLLQAGAAIFGLMTQKKDDAKK